MQLHSKHFDADVEVSTRLVGRVDPDNAPLKNFDSNEIANHIRDASKLGVEIKILHKGKYNAGGLNGKTVLFSYKEKGVKSVSFRWFYPGIESSANKPEISIHLMTPGYKSIGDNQIKELMDIWFDMLKSLAPVGIQLK